MGAVSGILAALLALGVAEAVAAILGRTSSPVVVVGGAFVDRTPRPLKEFAIRTFGANDKNVLLTGIVLVVLALAAAAGAAAVRRPVVGTAAVVLLGLVASLAAASRPTAHGSDVLPSVIGALAGLLALTAMVNALRGVPDRDHDTVQPSNPVQRLRDSLSMVDRKASIHRRGFLLASVGAGSVAAVAGAVGRSALRERLDVSTSRDAVVLPRPADPAPEASGAPLRVAELSPFRTPTRDFYRVDTALVVPQISTDRWSLRIRGRVDRPLELSWADLLRRPMIERDITLTCVSNEVGGGLVGTARWLGVALRDLLLEVGPQAGADQIVSRSPDGMTIGTPTAAVLDGRDAMLAIGMNGEPLQQQHGFPVRMVVPGLYGYVSATKWVVDLELTTFAHYDAYWVPRGYAAKAPIKTQTRIDTPRQQSSRRPGRIAVAGVAWAQTRGIERVQVRVDGGPWNDAALGPVATKDTWRQWLWTWDAEPGKHTLQARATDGTGSVQPGAHREVAPDGATGWHEVTVTVAG